MLPSCWKPTAGHVQPFSAMSIQSAAWRIGRDTCLAAELRYRWVVWFSSLEGDLRMQRIGDLDAKSIKIRACVVSFYQKTCGLRMLPIRAGLCKSAKADALCSNWIELTTNGSNFELSMFFCIVWTILIFRNDPGHFQPQCHNEIAGICPRYKKSRANSWWPRHSNEAVQNWIQCQHTIFGSQRALKSLYSVATCSQSTASIDWKCMVNSAGFWHCASTLQDCSGSGFLRCSFGKARTVRSAVQSLRDM